MPMPMHQRFWAKVRRARVNECWEWTGTKNAKGYGIFRLHQTRCSAAHRVAYEIATGPIPSGMLVLHRCDNPSCCNPAHLFIGTHIENMADMTAKKRNAFGVRSPKALLTPEQVIEIRSIKGCTKALAAKFGVREITIRCARSRRTWAWLKSFHADGVSR